jgi:dihydroneopterin aldolase
MDPVDEITLTGVRAWGHHGVYDDERAQGQEFVVDLTLRIDTAPAAASDDVIDTVHYGELAERVVALVGADPVNLLETLAARIAADALTDPRVEQAVVTIHKPSAPIAVPFGDVAVTIRRSRPAPRAVPFGFGVSA